MKLRVIGYWRGGTAGGDRWPDPMDFVDWSWDEEERRLVERYLRHGGLPVRVYRGKHQCRLCGQLHGALDVSDDAYMWPDGLAHYVRAHGVRLPDEFVRHVKSRMQEPRKIAVDTSWWRHQKPQWHGLPTRPPMVFDPFDDDWRHDRASDEQRT